MIAPSIPHHEADRLRELLKLGLLDTPPEERYDRLTRLASTTLGTKFAYVSLIDTERQWVKSRCGTDLSETARSVSFCGHAILHDDAMVVPDALDDERFFDNPLVIGHPRVRFYAGQPIKAPSGHAVGTLCVADPSPRPATGFRIDILRDLAGLIEREMTLVDAIEAQRSLLAARDALAEAHRRIADEVAVAAEYVEGLLPEPQSLPNASVDFAFVPTSELGGDFVGIRRLDQHRVAVYLLDVTGHGVAAALMAVSVHNTTQELIDRTGGDDPREVLEALNAGFRFERHGSRFITMWYGVLDASAGTITYCSAGHPPALMIRGGEAWWLAYGGTPLGILPDLQLTVREQPLREGDTLMVVSDGLLEARGELSNGIGAAELANLIVRRGVNLAHPCPRDVIAQVMRAVGTQSLTDDATAVCIHIAKTFR